MPENLIREIAQQIVQQQILENWIFYALILAVSVVSVALSALLTSYIRKRAETYASKADLKELVRQLEETTKAAEKVKAAISHEDWAAREWKTLRRVKLEELLEVSSSLEPRLEMLRRVALMGGDMPVVPEPIAKMEQLASLYFPELRNEVEAVRSAYYVLVSHVFDASLKLAPAGISDAGKDIVINAFFDAYSPAQPALIHALASLQAKAPEVLLAVMQAETGEK
ncbi:hypothetical protein [Uliginosibacterium sp. 31-12]|uniref:hypothetical protein n=1 Tax=Uliginosibacterium sp. 31-12 TaxID=3062781 RepID=UPI0026E2BCED|nr:hypothetical protein [Uliginosibacterium sp. 31-12]MDO6385276.1 hypothetical protein [Uliginosibacterium sp. 31-12]